MVAEPGADLYAVLGVRPGASEHDIKLAYRGQIKKVHPDYAIHNRESDRIRRTEASAVLNAAYAVLRDPQRRADYDRQQEPSSVAPAGNPASGASSGVDYAAKVEPDDDQFMDIDPLAPFVHLKGAAPVLDPLSASLGSWLRLTHEGQWVALILAIIAINLLNLLVHFPSPLGPDLTLFALILLGQPLLAGRRRETPLADLLRGSRQVLQKLLHGLQQFLAACVHPA
jgi:hypothetical protein